MSRYTKLDTYDYDILPGVIRIHLCGKNDPDLVDIMSEIDRSNGNIYVEGRRYTYLNEYEIVGDYRQCYMDLQVKDAGY